MLKAEREKGDVTVYSFTLTMAASLLKSMPERTAMTCEMLRPKASPEYPLMGEIKRITLHVVHDEMDKRPVHADIVERQPGSNVPTWLLLRKRYWM